MLPYAFSAMTMSAVGLAAKEMIEEIRKQFLKEDVRGGRVDPDYDSCIAISTNASLKKMIGPGILVIFTPLVVGYLFGYQAVFGLLAGTIVSGV
jgi:Na+/H+-translocating membrane pyrophosphatase